MLARQALSDDSELFNAGKYLMQELNGIYDPYKPVFDMAAFGAKQRGRRE